MILKTLGMTERVEQQWGSKLKSNQLVGRVVIEHKHMYRVMTEQGELLSTLSGSFHYQALDHADYPAVGDWVIIEKLPNEQKAIIHKLVPRFSKFSRKTAGTRVDEQIVAANIDYLFIVTSMNADFNIRRLERYFVAASHGGVIPIVVLTKADLCEDEQHYVQQLQQLAMDIDFVIVSALENKGLKPIKDYLKSGKTGAFIGSSGVGKSTLTNALVGTSLMEVSTIRERDAKGRHTTTHRELLILPTGGCLIDTPGMRELQLWEQSDSVDESFLDIQQLSATCKFRDCSHQKEVGCAVREGVLRGILSKQRLNSYFKLERELQFLEKRTQQQQQLNEKRKQNLKKKRKN